MPSNSSCESDISMSSAGSEGCSGAMRVVVVVLNGGKGALSGVGEAGWEGAEGLVLFGIVRGLPKVGGKYWVPTGGGAWRGMWGGEGEVGAFRLLLTRSIGVGVIACAGWIFMQVIFAFWGLHHVLDIRLQDFWGVCY